MGSEGRISRKGVKTLLWIGSPILIYIALLIPEISLSDTPEPKDFINTAVVMPFVIAFTLYLLDKRKADANRIKLEKEKTKQAFNSLRTELEDTHSALSGDKQKFSYKGKTVEFTDRYLNHNIYDSLNATGAILYINHVQQQKIQNIVKKIKMHNEYLKKAVDITIENVDDNVPDETYRLVFQYYLIVQKYEYGLSDDIHKIINEK